MLSLRFLARHTFRGTLETVVECVKVLNKEGVSVWLLSMNLIAVSDIGERL
jgi:hypothetical protein